MMAVCITLDGLTQYVTVPDELDVRMTDTNRITVMAWISPARNTTSDLVKKYVAGTPNKGFEFSLSDVTASPSQRVFIRFNGLTALRVNSNTQYPIDGTWIHAAATYDGERFLYI